MWAIGSFSILGPRWAMIFSQPKRAKADLADLFRTTGSLPSAIQQEMAPYPSGKDVSSWQMICWKRGWHSVASSLRWKWWRPRGWLLNTRQVSWPCTRLLGPDLSRTQECSTPMLEAIECEEREECEVETKVHSGIKKKGRSPLGRMAGPGLWASSFAPWNNIPNSPARNI